MKRLVSIVCIDRIKFFELDYYYDSEGKIHAEKKIVKKKNPIINSVIETYPVADFYEREIFECFGVKFKNGNNAKLFLEGNEEIKHPLLQKKKKGDKNA
ncbi:MAG: NADH-quinone oxidoreductase subunit C [Candidatus Nanoarchaeia archaeon]|nr:NADH-quinone oxidoreductase subunit C [Candidatus Nanoarchaeia archaeon]MDD5499765.1 NADH-quinone oxidoreductase subunit C [Candidatus Nanoarchaeia archaeon]